MIPSGIPLEMSKVFTNYLRFSRAAQEVDRFYKIYDHKERLILEIVLEAYLNNAVLGVLDLVLIEGIASQATLHSVMKALVTKKLIKTEVSKQDGRRKHVLPTKLGLAWLKDTSELFASSLKR